MKRIPLDTLSVMIKPASSACNLTCKYCFYTDVSENRSTASYPVMTEETVMTIAQRINEALDHKGTVNISFQGGEPTTAGLSFFEMFTKIFEAYTDIEVHYSMQTNATRINDAWAQFLQEHHFLVGVSLDGYQTNMDYYRYDVQKRSVYFQVLRGIDCLKKANVEFNILTVVTNELSKHGSSLLKFYLEHHFDYVQLIPCLPGLTETENEISLTPEQYASFYIDFFQAWKKAYRKGNRISVNLFENLAGMLAKIPPYQCGMIGRCSVQYVIEANGNVYPCDFYCLDEDCLGNLKDASFDQLSNCPKAKEFLASSNCMKEPCRDCPVRAYCNGGCHRQNVCYLNAEFCAYQKVLLIILPQLQQMIPQR